MMRGGAAFRDGSSRGKFRRCGCGESDRRFWNETAEEII